ncbi:MAG: AAA family ATPase [Nanoarchaeota archaeon]|nr:AAA family ATPase [Nanoarchaeota archaeon]
MDSISCVSFKPLHRREQLKVLEQYFKGLNAGHREHMFLQGGPGSGKTFCITHMLNKYNSKSSYIDCSVYKTRSAIVTKILIDFGFAVARSGPSFDYLYEKLDKFLQENKTLIVLDDLHKLHKREMEVFNDLIEKASVIAISFNDSVLNDMDSKSIFLPIRVSFPSYTKDELTDILKQRFGNSDGLDQISNYACTHNGNCRLAVECSKRIKQRWNKIDLSNTLVWLNEIGGI